MKKVFFAASALFLSITFVNAQSTATESSTTTAATTTVQQEKVKIKSEDLPDAVKKSLNSDEYRGWLINSAYLISDADKSKAIYEVEVKNGAETKTFKFDKDGKKMD